MHVALLLLFVYILVLPIPTSPINNYTSVIRVIKWCGLKFYVCAL